MTDDPYVAQVAWLRARREVLAARRVDLQRRLAARQAPTSAARDAAAAWDAAARLAAPAPVRALGGPPDAQPDQTRPIRVLVVDDLAAMRRLLVRQLTRAGHEVAGEAGTAAEALAGARALAPDVVLLDVHLPDGFGPDVATRLAEPPDGAAGAAGRRPARPPGVVFCTGDPAAALDAGAGRPGAPWGLAAVLEKLSSPDALDRAVRAVAAARLGPALRSVVAVSNRV